MKLNRFELSKYSLIAEFQQYSYLACTTLQYRNPNYFSSTKFCWVGQFLGRVAHIAYKRPVLTDRVPSSFCRSVYVGSDRVFWKIRLNYCAQCVCTSGDAVCSQISLGIILFFGCRWGLGVPEVAGRDSHEPIRHCRL